MGFATGKAAAVVAELLVLMQQLGKEMGSSLSLESEAWVTNGKRLGSMLDVNVGEGRVIGRGEEHSG